MKKEDEVRLAGVETEKKTIETYVKKKRRGKGGRKGRAFEKSVGVWVVNPICFVS